MIQVHFTDSIGLEELQIPAAGFTKLRLTDRN